jgi:hypothetical protein
MNYNLELYKELNNRKRITPVERKEHLLIAYIGMVVGDIMIGSDNPPCYLTVGHGDIADATGISVATVFNYFNTVKDLHCEIEEWAITHTAETDKQTREAAKAIVIQWAAIFPLNANACGVEIDIATAKSGA